MTDIAAFPAFDPLDSTSSYTGQCHQGITLTFLAGSAITAGQVVAFAATPVDWGCVPCVAATTLQPIGVALEDIASGAKGPIMVSGVCYVANGDDTTAIDAGAVVGDYGGTTTGTVVAKTDSATGYQIGLALDAIAANGLGRIIVKPGIITKGA